MAEHVNCQPCGGVFEETLTDHLARKHANVVLDITSDPRSGHHEVRNLPCPRCGKTWINGTCDDTVSRRALCARTVSTSGGKGDA